MKKGLLFCMIFSVFTMFSQDPEGSCGYSVLQGTSLSQDPTLSSLTTNLNCIPGDYVNLYIKSGIIDSIYLAVGELFIRAGEEVGLYMANCGFNGNTYIYFNYSTLADSFQLVQGIADTEYVSSSTYNYIQKRFQFSEDAIIEIPNLIGTPSLYSNGEKFAIKVFVVPYEVINNDTIPLPKPIIPFLTQGENSLNITISSDKVETVEMYNSLGQKVRTFQVKDSLKVDLSPFESGMYFFLANTEEERLHGKAVVH